MATFKTCVYRNHLRQDGTYNVKLRVTHDRTTRKISTPYYVEAYKVSTSLEILDQEIINLCDDLCYDCRKICRSFGFSIDRMSIDELVFTLEAKLRGDGDNFRLDFCKYWEDQAAMMSQGTGGNYRTALRAFKRFINNDSFEISNISTRVVGDFMEFIKQEPSQRGSNRKEAKTSKGGFKTRGVSMYVGQMRAIYNRAKVEFNDEDSGFIPISKSPFSKIKLVDPVPKKRAVTVEIVQRIIDLPYRANTDPGARRFNLAKDCFIISFGLIGINSVDLYYCDRIVNGILVYNRRKTSTRRADLAEMQVRIEPEVMPLIMKYRDRYKNRIFSFYREYTCPADFNRAINQGLKVIAKELQLPALQFYAARHTWATIARSHLAGIDKYTVHEALNHVDLKMRVTDMYITKDWTVIWDAHRKVMELLKWPKP